MISPHFLHLIAFLIIFGMIILPLVHFWFSLFPHCHLYGGAGEEYCSGQKHSKLLCHRKWRLYNPRKSNSAPYGPFNRYTLGEQGIISPLYTRLVLKADIFPSYLAWYFKSDAWYRYRLTRRPSWLSIYGGWFAYGYRFASPISFVKSNANTYSSFCSLFCLLFIRFGFQILHIQIVLET